MQEEVIDTAKVFIVILAVGVIWAWFLVPETKGLPLEEIAALFGDSEDIAVYLRDVHVDQTNDQLVVAGRHEKEGDYTEKASEPCVRPV